MSDWRSLLLTKESRTGQRVTLPLIANVNVILAEHELWKGRVAWDAFRESVVRRCPPVDAVDRPADEESFEWREWSDEDSTRATLWLSRNEGVHVTTKVVDQAIAVVAQLRIVHPVREYLDGLKWDSVDRVDTWLATYLGAPDTPYTRNVGRCFLIGAVARVMRPGCKVDCTPILEGRQGEGKSTAVRVLAGDSWFFDTPITMGEKDSYQALRGKWIGELGELHSLSRSDLNKAKNFLSAPSDTFRASYGRRTRDYPRQIVFVGTTNASEYLRDETGNRRFWPVRCGRIDLEGLRAERNQLWAEAVQLYDLGETWHVDSPQFADLCAAEQEARFVADEWETPISEWLERADHPERVREGVTAGEVLTGALGIMADKWTKAEQDRAASVLRRLGWARGNQRREGGRVVRRWRPAHQPGDRYEVTNAVTSPVTSEVATETLVSPASPAIPCVCDREPGSDRPSAKSKPAVTPVTGDAPFSEWVDGALQ